MRLSRRDFLRTAAMAPTIGMALPILAGQPTSLALAENAFIVNDRPRFLIGGSIDYFRCPHQLWRDRLLKARRAGLNAVATCVAWNFHEPKEGVYDFTGDRDIGRFLDLCGELGLFVFLRPGPFICDEWEAGGYPAWLIGKPNVETRTNHPPTLALVRRWFEQLIPRVAAQQVTRGGPVLFVQQENEFYFVGRSGIREYQNFLIRTLRDLGIEVPITDCSGFHAETRRKESLQTINGWSLSGVEQLRGRQPGKPVIVSEFYTHWIECWGEPEEVGPGPAALGQQTFECLSAAAMPFYFMFHGGTSFGHWPSRTWKKDYAFVTPRYYDRGPIAEGGALNDTYFAVKSAALAAQTLESVLAGAKATALPVTFSGPVHAVARQSPSGTVLFVTEQRNKDDAVGEVGVLVLSSGRRIELAQRAAMPAILPFQFQLDAKHRVDFCNASIVAASEHILVVTGEQGRKGVVSVNGEIGEFTFTGEPTVIKPGGAVVMGVPTSLAARTWLADGRVIVGPAYVGEQRADRHECWCDAETKAVHFVSNHGGIAKVAVPVPQVLPKKFRLTNWVGRSFTEIEGAGPWCEIGSPRAVEELGAYWGYTWYRAQFQSDGERQSALMFTEATDRIHVFLRGKRVGVWGRGAGASRNVLPVDLRAGDNQFVFLCDNMGRSSEGSCLDRKGILGPVYLNAHEVEVHWTEGPAPNEPPGESWRFLTYRDSAAGKSLSRSIGSFIVDAGQALVISIRSVPQYAWLALNGKPVGEHGGDLSLIDGVAYSTHFLENVSSGGVRLEMTFYGDLLHDIHEHVRVFACPQDRRLSSWGFRPWNIPSRQEPAKKDLPACWECRFAKPDLPAPLFFEPRGLSKGHVILNGHAAGGYWSIGPQKTLYLPEPWLQEVNRLIVFDEAGLRPTETRLIRDQRVPTQMILA